MKKIIILLMTTFAFASCDPNNGNGGGVTPNNVDTTMIDVAYGSDANQKMDIYLPKNRTTANTKVIVLIHGGAWNAGDKSEMNVLIPKIQSKWPEVAIANNQLSISKWWHNHS